MESLVKKMPLKKQYDQDGVVFPIPVLSDQELKSYQKNFQELEARYEGVVPRCGWSHVYFDWAFQLVLTPKILDAVEAIIGPEILVQGTLVLNKYPDTKAFVPWHQDGRHSQLPPSQSTSAWVALSESKIENGCMRFLPGTHQGDYLLHESITDADSMVVNGGGILKLEKEEQAKHILLQAGEMSLHQNNVVHGSLPNLSSEKRTGFIIRYTTPAYQGTTPVIRARGVADCSHLHMIDRPLTEQGEAAFIAHEIFLNQRGEYLGPNLFKR